MTRSFFRSVVAGAAAALSLVSASAQGVGATLTFNDPNCASFAITGTAPNFTLACQTLACSISASPASPTPGQQVTLTGSCTGGGAVTYTWTSLTNDPNCATTSLAGSPVATVSPPAGTIQTCAYRVSGQDNNSLTGTATTSVAWSNTPVSPPSGCTLTASPSSLTAAGPVTLTAACTNGAPTSYAWAGAGVTTPTAGPSQPVTVSATTTFTVIPSNAGGNGNTATATVTVGAPPPPAAGATCTIKGTVYTILDMGQLPFTQIVGTTGMSGSKVAIGTLVVPPGLNTTVATLSVFDWGSTTYRKMWLSKSRCDTPGWTPPVEPGTTGATQNPTLYFSIGGSNPSAVIMQPGETWYVMVVNQNFLGGNSCNGTCNLGVTWSRPN